MTSPVSSRPTTSTHGQVAPKGAALYERTQSYKNTPSVRPVYNDNNDEKADRNILTPFPTKPSQVLLPSRIRERERRLGANDENMLPGGALSSRVALANTKAKRLGSDHTPEGPPTTGTPTIRLKRSVKTLRDLFDAQAETTRPSTATSSITSPVLRPSTAGSGLRSFSSRDALRGPQGWDLFHKAASSIMSGSTDDIGALPTLDEVTSELRRSGSVHTEDGTDMRHFESDSFQPDLPASSSSPNVQTFGTSSSPPTRSSRSMSSPMRASTRRSSLSNAKAGRSSSPNYVTLENSSSPRDASATSSSPNVMKLGTSSPDLKSSHLDEEDSDSPDTIRRKESYNRIKNIILKAHTEDGPSFATRMKDSDPFTSSPTERTSTSPLSGSANRATPTDREDPASSPPFSIPSIATGLYQDSDTISSGVYSSSSNFPSATHSNLQAAIDSSPPPIIQYPTIRAPRAGDGVGLNIAKRGPRQAAETYAEKWNNRLSAVPSEWAESVDNDTYAPAASVDDDSSDVDSFLEPPARAYLASNREASGSTIRMISDADRREATDSVADLRPSEYRSPQLQPRSSGILSLLSSSASRSNSMRNSMDTRFNSMLSYTSSRQNSLRSMHRPDSSDSLVSNLPLPTWARRYYSGGVPKDYFYSASQITSTTNLTPRPSTSAPRPSTSVTYTSTSRTSTPRSPLQQVARLFRPRARPRFIHPRQSHLEPGIGPLVSNPVEPQVPHSSHQRTVSTALDPADPRAHWAGLDQQFAESVLRHAQAAQGPQVPESPSSTYRFFPRRRDWSPHLHQDWRAGGHPRRSLWHAPSMDENREILMNRRNAQVFSFILGFIFPVSWFVAAFLPLPPKPSLQMDEINRIPTPNLEAQLQQQIDVQEDIRYENARWWRILNRFMCLLGICVIAIVVTLAVIFH